MTIFGMTPYFVFSAVVAFIAMISFFNINSAWADKIGQPKGNRIFLWTGIALTILSLYLMYMAKSVSTGTAG